MTLENISCTENALISLSQFQNKFKEKRIDVNQHSWRVIDTADVIPYDESTPALIFLPGTQGAPSIFWNQIRQLLENIRIYSLGYPPLKNAFDLAKSLANFIKQEKIQKPNILGTSLGGYVAQIVAIDYPECIDHLIIANSMVDARLLVSKRTPGKIIQNFTDAQLYKNVIERIDGFPTTDKMSFVLKAVLTNTVLNLMTPEEIKCRFLALENCELLKKLNILDEKILIIDCEDDFVIPEQSRIELRQRYASSTRITFEKGGHFPYITCQNEYTEIIKNFLYHKHNIKLDRRKQSDDS